MVDRRQHGNASPTERTLAELRVRGQYPVPCENWKPVGGRCFLCRNQRYVRTDLMGFADVLALPSLTAIQTTSGDNHAARVTKILSQCQEAAWWWLSGGGHIEVWSWAQRVKPVNGKHWRLRVTEITPSMLLDAGWVPPPTTPELFPEESADDANTTEDGHSVRRRTDLHVLPRRRT